MEEIDQRNEQWFWMIDQGMKLVMIEQKNEWIKLVNYWTKNEIWNEYIQDEMNKEINGWKNECKQEWMNGRMNVNWNERLNEKMTKYRNQCHSHQAHPPPLPLPPKPPF